MKRMVKEKDVRRVVEMAGATLESVSLQKCNHYKVRFRGNGRKGQVMFPLTPSDVRWEKNKVGEIRTRLSGHGASR